MKKKIILFVVIPIIIVVGILLVLILNPFVKKKDNKDIKDENIKVTNVDTIELLNEPDDSKAVELINNNIVRITNELEKGTITGTGFFNSDGYLITCSHVVDRKGKLRIEYPDGTIDENIELFSNDIVSDIALLKVENPKVKALKFGNTLELKAPNELFATGYAYNLKGVATVVKGILSARRSNAGIEYLQLDISLNEGQSGGPVFNSKAELVGMNTLATTNSIIGMAISAETLENSILKLVNDPKVNYVEEERPANALSNVLKEVGYLELDIFYEQKFYMKIEINTDNKPAPNNNSNNNTNNEPTNNNSSNNNKPATPKSNENRIKSINIPGGTFHKPFSNNGKQEYSVTLVGGQTSIELQIELMDSKSTYRIEGDPNHIKIGSNNIFVYVKSESGKEGEYLFNVIGRTTSSSDINSIHAFLDRIKNDSGQIVYQLSIQYIDGDGFQSLNNSNYDIVDHYEIEVHTKKSGDPEYDRLVTTLNLTPPPAHQYFFEFPESKIKDNLIEDDYENGVLALNSTIKMYTKDNRVFSASYATESR